MADQYWDNVVLALPMYGVNGSTTFTDISPTPKAVTRYGNTVISTAQSKFGGTSAYFDGSGDYLIVPGSVDFDLYSGGNTVELWIYFMSTANTPHIISIGKNADNRNTLWLDGSKLKFTTAISGVYRTIINSTTTISTATWYHIALVKDLSTLYLFINGALDCSVSGGLFLVGGSPLVHIGHQAFNSTASDYLKGYIDDLRITKGVARYTANFTPPASSYFFADGEVYASVESVDASGTAPIVGFGSFSPQVEAISGGDNAIIGTGEVSPQLASLSASGSSEAVVTLNNGQVRAKIDAISGSGSTSIVGVGAVHSKKDAISSNGLSGEWVGSAVISSKVEMVVASGRSLVVGRGAIGSTHRPMSTLNGHGIVPIVGGVNIVGKCPAIVAGGAMCQIGAAIIQGKIGVVSSRGTTVIKGVGDVLGKLPIVAGRRHEKVAVATLGFYRGTLSHGLSPAPAIEPIHFTR